MRFKRIFRWDRILPVAAGFVLFYFLFRSILLALVLSPWGLYSTYKIRQSLRERRDKAYMTQFQDFLMSFSMAASAGRTGKSLFTHSYEELKVIHPESGEFLQDLRALLARCAMDRDIFEEFSRYAAGRSREEIRVFAEMLYLISRKGGDACRVTSHCSDLIRDKIKLEADREVLLARQKMEMRMITIVPVIMLYMMKTMNPGYLEALYGSPAGIVALVAAIGCIGVAIWMGNKICASPG